MRLRELKLEGFRNYEQQVFTFTPHITILSGGNAQGKTNVLEALYLLAVGRSHRISGDKDLLKEGSEGFRLQLVMERHGVRHELESTLGREPHKRLKVDQKLYRGRLGGVMSGLRVVLFAPEDLELIKGAPAVRRRFLDEQVFIASSAYKKLLNRYTRILTQRNRILKDHMGKYLPTELLSSWNDQLVESGCDLMVERARAVHELGPVASRLHQRLSGGEEALSLRYLPAVPVDPVSYRQELLAQLPAERARGVSLVGPHRDDLSLQIGGLELRSHGSQGQQRSAVLALKVAVREQIHRQDGVIPVLLLDDVLSELDNARQQRLLAILGEENQTIITCTDTDLIVRSPSMQGAGIYQIVAGTARRVV